MTTAITPNPGNLSGLGISAGLSHHARDASSSGRLFNPIRIGSFVPSLPSKPL